MYAYIFVRVTSFACNPSCLQGGHTRGIFFATVLHPVTSPVQGGFELVLYQTPYAEEKITNLRLVRFRSGNFHGFSRRAPRGCVCVAAITLHLPLAGASTT